MLDQNDTDEDYYFEINVTRSQLSDIICRNEDCEAAQLFAERGIGPLVPKDPYECYDNVQKPRPQTVNIETQSPKKYPCGNPKCKYLNVHPDGTPIGCGKVTCKYKRTICNDPGCIFNKLEIKTVCPICGGYSLSGKTCKDIKKEDECLKNEETQESKCHEECKFSDKGIRNKNLIAPASLLPFDQLQASAHKERLLTMQDVFIDAIKRLNEEIMPIFEKHFDCFNPHVNKESATRGDVWYNNKFYTFYVDVATLTLEYLRDFLKDIWNQSVRDKTAKIPEPIHLDDYPSVLIMSVENTANDIVQFICDNFGMASSSHSFFLYIKSVIMRAVTVNKYNIPPRDIPSTPNLGEGDTVDTQVKKKPRRSSAISKLTSKTFYCTPSYGHKDCLPYQQNSPNVPKNMGWLWNLGECVGRLKPWRYYKPGAVTKAVAKIIKIHHENLVLKSGSVKTKRKKVQEIDMSETEPMLSVYKRQGAYLIKLIPSRNPYLDDEQNQDYAPLIFLINKKQDKIVRINNDGTEEPITECQCKSEENSSDESSSSSDDDEFEIKYTPPILLVNKEQLARKVRKDMGVQCVDLGVAGKTKKGKK